MLSLLTGMTAETSDERLHETRISLWVLTGYMEQIAVELYLKLIFYCLMSELPCLFLFVLLNV